jgi:hypothetical protein
MYNKLEEDIPTVLYITTHGEIDSEEETISPIAYDTISATILGVCNYATEESEQALGELIERAIQRIHIQSNTLDVCAIQQLLMNNDTNLQRAKNKYINQQELRWKLYAAASDRAYRTTSYNKGAGVLNKRFVVYPKEIEKKEYKYSNSIRFLNKRLNDLHGDLVKTINKLSDSQYNKRESVELHVSNLLAFIRRQNLNNVIIIDASCQSGILTTRQYRILNRCAI